MARGANASSIDAMGKQCLSNIVGVWNEAGVHKNNAPTCFFPSSKEIPLTICGLNLFRCVGNVYLYFVLPPFADK